MIVAQLIGGLGNQMFIYAIGRNLSIRNNTELVLDTSSYSTYKKHSYLLNNFNIVENYFFDRNNLKTIKEQSFKFNEELLKPRTKDNFWLWGYFQSEKYFLENYQTIKKEFTLKKEIPNLIKKENSVSIHVRRGDYITEKDVNRVHGVCSLDYYRQAIQLIKSKISSPFFFIFSDDIDWCKKNLQIENSCYMQNKSYEDLYSMSLCNHNIIANSTFSWWAAYLNNNNEKIVIAPKKWFNAEIDDKDLIPENWIRI